MAWSFRLTSYNILADAYATARLYPSIHSDVLAWGQRGPAIVNRICQLEPDVICLQEVQASHWPGLKEAYSLLGWQGSFAQKRRARQDGCAVLVRDQKFRLVDIEPFYFADGEEISGHLALIASFDTPAGLVSITTTHLRWQASTPLPDQHIGYRQALQLLDRLAKQAQPSLGMVICGDFNVPPYSSAVQLFQQRGFLDTYAAAPQPTCNPNGRATRIDYILATSDLAASAEPIPLLRDETPMPNADEPSDHLPVTVELSPSQCTYAKL